MPEVGHSETAAATQVRAIRVVEITHAGCCLDRTIGGPGFNIRFKDGDYRGVIFNPFDGQILDDREAAARVDVDDYIVVVEEGPPTR